MRLLEVHFPRAVNAYEQIAEPRRQAHTPLDSDVVIAKVKIRFEQPGERKPAVICARQNRCYANYVPTGRALPP